MTTPPPTRTSPPCRRRRRLTIGVASAAAVTTVLAFSASGALASDTLPWTGDSAAGENQPYQHGYTAPEILDWNPATDPYAEMLRARVPLQERNAPQPLTQRNPDLPAETQMVNLAGDYGNAFFESHQGTNEFSQNLFNFWQYTDVYAPWHGMPVAGVPKEYYDPTAEWTQKWFEFGMLNLPNPAYTNAAHANGTLSIACIFFSANDRGDQTYRELLVRDADGSFPVAEKLIEVAGYYGFDGYFINQEELAGVDPADVPVYKEFLKVLRDGGMYVQWYDSTNSPGGELVYQNAFNATNSPWVLDPDQGRLTDSMFLNYWWNADILASSQAHAQSLGLDPLETVFAGVEAGKDQFNQFYDLDQIFDGDGAPRVSIATLGADFVSSDYADKTDDTKQWEVFDRERRWWTGSATGTDAPEGSWDGMSKYIAERSVISGSEFATNFSTGHGLATWIDGSLSSDAEWGDINRQDQLPTWQWWVETSSASPMTVDFDYGPDYVSAERFSYDPVGGYNGGNSLVISGDLDADTTLRLFQTDLEVTAESELELTYLKPWGDDSELRAAMVLASDPETVVSVPLVGSGAATDGWQTATVDLAPYAGERILTLGVGVTAGPAPIADYQVNIGSLRVAPSSTVSPAAPRGFSVDEYLPGTDEMFVSWDLDEWDDVRRYELFLDQEMLGGGYDRVHYVKNVPERAGTLRLVAVGHDGSRSVAATLPFDPASAPTDVEVQQDGTTATVSWAGGGDVGGTISVQELYGDRTWSQAFAAGESAVVFDGVPTDGSQHRVVVTPTGATTAATTRGAFIDTEITAYPAEAASIKGTALRLTRPTLDDWRTLTIQENGVPLQFDTTYSQGQRPYVSRGRTTYPAMSPTLASTDSEVVAIIEDYAGNTARTVLRAGPVAPEPEPTTGPEPEPTTGPTTAPTTAPTAAPGPQPSSPTSPGGGGTAGPAGGPGGGSGGLAATGGDLVPWALLGAGGMALLGSGWLLLRRRRSMG